MFARDSPWSEQARMIRSPFLVRSAGVASEPPTRLSVPHSKQKKWMLKSPAAFGMLIECTLRSGWDNSRWNTSLVFKRAAIGEPIHKRTRVSRLLLTQNRPIKLHSRLLSEIQSSRIHSVLVLRSFPKLA